MIEKILNKLFKKRIIVNCDRDPYLHRWYVIRTKRIGIFIHKFVRSDEDRALHDHPWNFIVIPIWRGYIEHYSKLEKHWITSSGNDVYERSTGLKRVYPIIGIRFRKLSYRHRVKLIKIKNITKPAWSIFIRFRKKKDWGFYDDANRYIQWKDWWNEKCE